MSKSRPGIGLLGGGMMAQVGHLPFYLSDPRCDVIAVVEERASVSAVLSAQLGADRVLSDRHSLLRRSDVDAIVVCAPRPATGPLTLEAIEAGKHVLVEKPMAHTVEQARRLVDAALAHRRIYMVGFMKRYDPGIRKAKALFDEVMQSEQLGRLLFARFYDYSKSYATPPPAHVRPKESRLVRYPTWPTSPEWLSSRHHGHFEWFLNAACHDVNLVSLFFPDSVEVTSAQACNEGAMAALMRWKDVPITLEIAKTEAGCWLEGVEFLFERGRIRLDIPSPMAVHRRTEILLDDLVAGIKGARVETAEGWCFERQATAFVDALTDDVLPLTSGEAAFADMELIEAIWRHVEG